MKKILLLLLSIVLVFALLACGKTPTPCEHGDDGEDGICDFCGTKFAECTHADGDMNGKCDKCGATTGECVHADDNGDCKCDKCGADYTATITIAEAIALCSSPTLDTSARYYIRATVKSVTNAAYGAMILEDETGEISVYGTYSSDGTLGYAELESKPYAGDVVLMHCTLQLYNGNPEVQNARLIEFTHIEADLTEYVDMSIADAREAETGTKIKLDGVVARITYANGHVPSGVILVDETSSIYVYDGDVAARVQIGNKITVAGAKTYWILESESANAASFGYRGCNQLENATLVSNDEKTDNEFNKTWITETTVKELLDKPVTEDITTLIYKVNAYVKKEEGKGFVNYYFYDLDYNTETGNGTGSYTYTQCNGSDFAWLDEFDGKICTVYITALNAKSTASDCFFRILPISVKDDNFTFNTAGAAEHAVKYYGVGQFEKVYTGNPELELITSVSSTLLGFEGAILTYTSSNTDVVNFVTEGDSVIMNCLAAGTATVTVKGSFGGVEYSSTVTVTVEENKAVDTVTVAEAVQKAVGETVTVRGIVGPSAVNQTAFYLFDESGSVPVRGTSAMFDGLAIGNEVVVTGVIAITKDGVGQLCIDNAKVVANYYGSHEYPTENIENITVQDFCALQITPENTLNVYRMTATVKFYEDTYSSTIKLSDGTVQITIYCNKANTQYAWLLDYADEELVFEVAACNWNGKSYIAGCILSVTTDDGKIVNALNFTA